MSVKSAFQKYSPIIGVIVTILVNYLIPQKLGTSVGDVSDNNTTLITPARWTFPYGVLYIFVCCGFAFK